MALAYYSASADRPPGRGSHEVFGSDDSQWLELGTIQHWRRILSNFHQAPITIWGLTFPTAEHAFQAAKFRQWPATMRLFAFGPDGSPPATGCRGVDARANRKIIRLGAEQLAVWDACSRAVLNEIRRAKFEQNAACRHVLLLTGGAQLIHIRQRQDAIRDHDLEALRDHFLKLSAQR